MVKNINVLLTAASRRVALVKAFKDGIRSSGLEGKVIGADIDPYSASLTFCDSFEPAPLSTSPDFIPRIKEICDKENISLIIPTIDEEIEIFGRHKNEFEKLGIFIPVVEEEIGRICNDKYLTYNFLNEAGLPIAQTFLPGDIKDKNMEFPLFIKPRIGRGAVAAYPVMNRKEFDFFIDYVGDPVIQTFLPGREFTIDVLCDFEGEVISVVPRERLVIRSGVSDRGKTLKDPYLIELAIKASKALRIVGPANFQCKLHEGKAVFFEVNPRFSGAIQLTIMSGANFPKMILEMLSGKVEQQIGNFRDGLTMVSYEESIYHEKNGHNPNHNKPK